jgi:hypothetical protein
MQTKGLSQVRPVWTCEEARNHLKSGDILFCCGRALFSKLVKVITKADISHVGILHLPDDSQTPILIHSMDFVGVSPLPLQAYAETYDHGYGYNGMLIVGRHAQVERLPDERVKAMIEFALTMVGRPYNREAVFVRAIQELIDTIEPKLLKISILNILLANLARRAVGMPLRFSRNAMPELKGEIARRVVEAVNNEALACSELVDRCFRAIQLQFSRSAEKLIPAPSQIAEDPNIEVVCRVLTRRGGLLPNLKSILHQ